MKFIPALLPLLILYVSSSFGQNPIGTVMEGGLGKPVIEEIEVDMEGDDVFRIKFKLKGHKTELFKLDLHMLLNGKFYKLPSAYGSIGKQTPGKKNVFWNKQRSPVELTSRPKFFVVVTRLGTQTTTESTTDGAVRHKVKGTVGMDIHGGFFYPTPMVKPTNTTFSYDSTSFGAKENVALNLFSTISWSNKMYVDFSLGARYAAINYTAIGNTVDDRDTVTITDEINLRQNYKVAYGTFSASFHVLMGGSAFWYIGGYLDVPIAGVLRQTKTETHTVDYVTVAFGEDSNEQSDSDERININKPNGDGDITKQPLNRFHYGALTGFLFYTKSRRVGFGFDVRYSISSLLNHSAFDHHNFFPVTSRNLTLNVSLRIPFN